MEILEFVLQVLLGITSLLLTLLILLHKGRGGGLSDMFGGGMTSSLGASGVAERNLNRITVILGLAGSRPSWRSASSPSSTPESDGNTMASGNSASGARASAPARWASRTAASTPTASRSRYWDALGNETVRYFAAASPRRRSPTSSTARRPGLPAGRDKDNPPSLAKLEPYKTHLAYVKERRTDEEAAALLDEALTQLRTRRGQIAPQD